MTLLTAFTASALLLPTIALGVAPLPTAVDLPDSAPVAVAPKTGQAPSSPSSDAPDPPTPIGQPRSGSPPEPGSRPDSGPHPGLRLRLTSEAEPEAEFEATPVGRWAWPLIPRPAVVRGFFVGPAPWSPGHRGVDLMATLGVGTPIRSPADGTVRFAGVVAGRPVLSIAHGNDLISSFEPARSTLRRGQVLHRGETIGHLGAGPTHCGVAPCLHWGVRKSGQYVNPLLLVPARRGPAVLLPLRPS